MLACDSSPKSMPFKKVSSGAVREAIPVDSLIRQHSNITRTRSILPVAIGALAVSVAGGLVFATVGFGTLSTHMAHHIALMNVFAPLVAIFLADRARLRLEGVNRTGGVHELWFAAAVQLIVLWAWHLPAAQRWGMDSGAGQLVMHASLLISAVVFWTMVLALAGSRRWQAILALLVTGKLACLLGSLLIFAPRLLYTAAEHSHPAMHMAGLLTVADQQLAGLLMVVACPLSYLVSGVVIASQMINELERRPSAEFERQPLSPVGR